MKHEYTRQETIGLASQTCVQCHGLGLLPDGKREAAEPCKCVFRAIFRTCLGRYRECWAKDKYKGDMTLENFHGHDSRTAWSRKDEDYRADFDLVSRRCLSAAEYQIFKEHFLEGATWKECCHKRNDMQRGHFFHIIYRMEAKLGRVYRELQPYALFPLHDYFHGPKKAAGVVQFTPIPRPLPLRPPLKPRRPNRVLAA